MKKRQTAAKRRRLANVAMDDVEAMQVPGKVFRPCQEATTQSCHETPLYSSALHVYILSAMCLQEFREWIADSADLVKAPVIANCTRTHTVAEDKSPLGLTGGLLEDRNQCMARARENCVPPVWQNKPAIACPVTSLPGMALQVIRMGR